MFERSEEDLLMVAGDTSSVPHTTDFEGLTEITVEAWVKSERKRPEALEALVSKWRPLDSFDTFAAFDAGQTDGLDSSGYFGAVFDGRYVYFSPEQHDFLEQHGIVLRYDTHGDFYHSNSYSAYNAEQTAGLVTKGFYGAVFDGRYVYFVPRQNEAEYHSRILRYDTRDEFKDAAAWDAFDVGEAHSQQSAAFDGRYIYFAPGFSGDPSKEDTRSGRVIRFDTNGPFKGRDSYRSVDITAFLGPEAACFDGAAFDGRYVYLVPLDTAKAVRYDTQGEFGNKDSWEVFDAAPLGMGLCVGAVFDGRFLYYVAYANSVILRFDTDGHFTDDARWTAYDADMTDGLDTGGFDGGFFDGRFVYFVAFVAKAKDSGENYIHSNFLRYDPRGDFSDPDAWRAVDASQTDGLYSVGFNGGAFDGRFFYCAPWRDRATRNEPGNAGVHGRVLRYDTVCTEGSFSLRYGDYGHNGGLGAAVPGPSFLVNTDRGVLGVAAHRVLEPGWHYLVGTYDGNVVRLYIDGVLAAERPGSGRIQDNQVPIAVGHIQDGLGRFSGHIEQVRVIRMARSAAQVEAAWRDKGKHFSERQ
jgi:hypothetical protein